MGDVPGYKGRNSPLPSNWVKDVKLSDEQKELALSLAIKGDTVTKIAEALLLTNWLFYRARVADPSFNQAFHDARAEGVNNQVDRLDNIHDEFEDPQVMRVVSDNIKWKASKLNPKTYGDKLDVNVTQTVDISGALDEAKKRIKDVTPIVPELPFKRDDK